MRQVTAVLIGAGLRGSEAYASYGLKYPNEFKIVAVAEPDNDRRLCFAALHKIPEQMQFTDYTDLFNKGKIADCALVCTQDRMHYEPVMMALDKGYDVLCEKPMSVDPVEITAMGRVAIERGRILSICHVLRYSPFFVKLKQFLDEGRIGRLMSIQHMESVGYWHHVHSFVRGNWRNSEESCPMILAKCCHDMDILLWLAGSECTKVSSFGELSWFRSENAPEDAPAYCLDGCRHRDECPYYAPKFYLEHEKAVADNLVRAVTINEDNASILEALSHGPYGRCVYHCDNTVVDHQMVNLEFTNGVQASLMMSAFTKDCRRSITLMGTHGQIIADMEESRIVVYDFLTRHEDVIHLHTPETGHSGSDEAMMKEFVQILAGLSSQKTGADVSVDSHLMALAAETSRLSNRVIDFADFKNSLL